LIEQQWLLALAGWGIDTDSVPPCLSTVGGVLRRVEEEKLIGVLAAAVAAGHVDVTDAERGALADAHRRAMGEALLLEEMLLRAVAVLDAAGIDHRVLKGAALAHTVHPDPSERSFGDNDLLVEPDRLGDAVDALTAAGGARLQPRLTAGFDRRFAKSVTMAWLHNTEIDLHRTLAPGPYGLLIDTRDLWEPPTGFVIASRRLHTFSPELHLLNAVLHVALGDVKARAGNLRDIALLCNLPDIDTDLITHTAEAWSCEAPLAAGLNAAARLPVDLGVLGEWASSREISPADRRLMSTYETSDHRFRRQALASMRVLPSWGDRLAYASAVARNPLRRALGSGYARRS